MARGKSPAVHQRPNSNSEIKFLGPLIDIDCIDQSVEIDDTLDFTYSIDFYRKIQLFFFSSKNEN